MKEQLISFETAKLAKEKGFPFVFNGLSGWGEFGEKTNNPELSFYDKNGNYNDPNKCQYSCTQSLLQKWLREKHNIYVNVASNSLTCHFPMNQIVDIDGTQLAGPKYKNYKTYEEALETGLLEALKLIK